MNIKKLEKLESLKQKGIINEEEFKEIREQIILELLKDDTKKKAKKIVSCIFRNCGKGKSLWEYFVYNLTMPGCHAEKGYRAARKEFLGCVLYTVISLCLIVIGLYALTQIPTGIDDLLGVFLTIVGAIFLIGLSFVFFFIYANVFIRRLNDIGFSGGWFILSFVSLILSGILLHSMLDNIGRAGKMRYWAADFYTYGFGVFILVSLIASFVLFFFCVFVPSDMKENKYGPVPKDVSD